MRIVWVVFIVAGDVLIVDECIISSIYKEVHWEFCNYCYKHCLSMIPCKLCGYVGVFVF